MQKALTQMNLHLHQQMNLHHVISDITGKTGLCILDAIVAGERDPAKLAQLRDRRIQSPLSVIEKALVGDYRAEHLFTLRQALTIWRHYQEQIAECDREIERLLEAFDTSSNIPPVDGSDKNTAGQSGLQKSGLQWYDPLHNTLAGRLRDVLGVNLTTIPGIAASTVSVLFSEIGPDLSAFPTAAHFASWLGLCPDNRISGGKILSVKTRKVQSRAATALRLAANSLRRSKSALGEYFRRLNARLGDPKAITAVAHKLARIVYTLMKMKTDYDESVFANNERQYQQRRINRLKKQAEELGFTLTQCPVS